MVPDAWSSMSSDDAGRWATVIGDVAGAAVSTAPAAHEAVEKSRSYVAYEQPLRVAVCVFVGYYLGARLGLALTFLPNPASVLWPPNAVMLAAMLVCPARLWWAIVAGAFPAHLLAELQGGVPAPMVLSWFVSNTAEALIGAGCVRALRREPITFDRLLDVSAFMLAAFVGAFLSSFIDSAFVALNRWGHSSYWEVWRSRLLSNVTAALTFVPVIVTWHSARLAALWPPAGARFAEAAALVAGLVIATVLVFDSPLSMSAAPAVIYVPLPFLLWAATRFGPRGASASFAMVALLVIWGTGHGLGPLGTGVAADRALSVQLFLMFAGPALLCLAAALAERSVAERSLRASDRRFQLVLRATNDAIYERAAGSESLWWSANGLAQFGYPREACPRTFAALEALIHPDDQQHARRTLAEAIDGTAQVWSAEFRLRRVDGTYAQVGEQGFIVRDRIGRPLQTVGALTDVTERRDADELNQRLAHVSRLTAMGELTAAIAHEINQPMSAILSNVDAAEMVLDAGAGDQDELRQILVDIRNDDLRAAEVIRHIRGLASKREIDFEPLDINDLARAVLRLVDAVAKRRGMSIDLRCGEVPRVRGDCIHIQQVLLNLIFNAMDAMAEIPEQRRRILVTTSMADVNAVEIGVRDHGHGILPTQRERIFESFFTTKAHGMGLGLSIARSLVNAHGGHILFDNNADGGVTFRFTLPCAAPDAIDGRQCHAR